MKTLVNNKERRIVEDKQKRWWFIDKLQQRTYQVWMYISNESLIVEK